MHTTFIPHLHKDGKENDHDGGCDEEPLLWEVINEEDQRKADCSSEATVGEDELVSKGHGVPPKLVHHSGEQENALHIGMMFEQETFFKV